MLISMKIKDGGSEVEGVNEACRLLNEVMNEWIDTKIVQDMLNENNDMTNRNKNWLVGKITIGFKKRVEFFIRVNARVRFYDLKSKEWDKCVEKALHTTVKNTKMKHVKLVRMLVGVWVPFASKEWHQQDTSNSNKEDENNIEIRIENMHR